MKYPKIIRDTIDYTSDTEICNIGYAEGELSDERPYRIEEWSSYGINNITVFISILDLEEKSELEIKKYLENENIIKIVDDHIYITEVEDVEENVFLSINVPLSSKDTVINECLITIKDYEY